MTAGIKANVDGSAAIQVGGTDAITLTSAGAATFVQPITLTTALAVTSGGTGQTTPLIPSGSAIIFVQTTAPTGWTKSTTHNNKALRVVSGAASSGGSVAFTTAFSSQAVSGTVGSTTLTTGEIPSHFHIQGYGGTTNPTARYGITSSLASARNDYDSAGTTTSGANTSSTGSGGSHNHTFTGTAIDLAVQYVDVIIATKD